MLCEKQSKGGKSKSKTRVNIQEQFAKETENCITSLGKRTIPFSPWHIHTNSHITNNYSVCSFPKSTKMFFFCFYKSGSRCVNNVQA